MKPRSSRETSVVARGSLFDGRLVDGGTDGSNPSPSSGESDELATDLAPIDLPGGAGQS